MIEFYNIRSGERRKCYTEPMIAAFYNSTNLHVNATVGQDMGWRLAPSTVKRMREIRADQVLLDRIAQAFSLPQGEVQDRDILNWISVEDERAQASRGQEASANYEKQYQQEIAELDAEEPAESNSQPRRVESKSQQRRKAAQSKARTVNRDASDGQFVSDEEVEANPDTTVTETLDSEEAENADSNSQSDNAKIEGSKPNKEK